MPHYLPGPVAMAQLLDPAVSAVKDGGDGGINGSTETKLLHQDSAAVAAPVATTAPPSRLPHRFVSIPSPSLSAAATASAARRPHDTASSAPAATNNAAAASASFPLFRAPVYSHTSQKTSLVTTPTFLPGYKDYYDDGTSAESAPQLDHPSSNSEASDHALVQVEKDVTLYTTPTRTLSLLPTHSSHQAPLGKRRGQHALSLSTSSTPRRRGRRASAAAARILDGHRPPPQPPAMQQATQHSLVASLLGTLPVGSDGSPNSSNDGIQHKPSSPGQGAAARGRVDVDKAAAPNGANGTGSSAQDEHEPAQPVALSPVDVREMLSHCDDATMSWSLQFWVTIADPLVRPSVRGPTTTTPLRTW